MIGRDGEPEARAAWTVLVYMAGDNNLTEEMAWGLQELKKTALRLEARRGLKAEDRINVVAHFDPRGSRSRRYDFSPSVKACVSARAEQALRAATDAEREQARQAAVDAAHEAALEVERASAAADGNLHDYEAVIYTRRPHDVAAGAEATSPISGFVLEQVERLPPARRYMLILSGHGSGAVGDFLNDSSLKTSLSIPQLARILGEAREAHLRGKGPIEQLDGPERIAILGMDSCLMSNAEVCYEVRDHADYLVGSEGWVANAGWPYHRVLEACLQPGSDSADDRAESVAKRLADRYASFYRDYEISGISTDIAVCDLGRLRQKPPLIEALSALSGVCTRAFDAVFVGDVLERARGELREAATRRTALCEGIVRALADVAQVPDGLLHALEQGSTRGSEALQASPRLGELTGTRRRALRHFLECLAAGLADHAVAGEPAREALKAAARSALQDLVVAEYLHASAPSLNDQQARFEASWQRLAPLVAKPCCATMALAAVRLRREFDPGVAAALGVIERAPAREGGQESAKKVRHGLQRLHQLQSVLELAEVGAGLGPDGGELRVLNAVVTSRWEAQSFKGGVYVDLVDLCDRLEHHVGAADFANLAELCRAVRREAAGVVVEGSLRQTGPDCQHAGGLSVYFPSQTGDYAAEYDDLGFAAATGWGRLVRSYLRATRRERRGEGRRWASDAVVRVGHSEVDPLEADGIEARIVGVIMPPLARDADESLPLAAKPPAAQGRAGVEERIRTALEERIRGDVEKEIRAGVEERIRGAMASLARAGVEERIRASVAEDMRAGVEERIRAGVEERIRAFVGFQLKAGLEERVRGADAQQIGSLVDSWVRAGVAAEIRAGVEERIRAGVEQRIRAGVEERIRAGVEERIRAGTETKIRSGTEAKIRGDGGLFVWGNPPDGFFRGDGPGGRARRPRA